MINDFRTRLLNLSNDELGVFDFTDPSYHQTTLQPPVSQLHAMLFPVTDVSQKSLLADCYLKVINAYFLEEYVTKYDSRITYKLENTFEDLASFDLTSVIGDTALWVSENSDWFEAKLKTVPDGLAKFYLTYSDNAATFAATLLIVFGRF